MSEPDLIVRGAKVITLDASSTIAEAFAVRDGQVSAVGAYADIVRRRGPQTRILDAAGKIVTPGFFDGHPHMDRQGLKARGGVPLEGCSSVAEIVERVREAVARTPKGQWVVTMPMGTPPTDYVYRPEQLAEGRFPTRQDLDAVSPDHPVYIRAPWGWWSHRPFPSVANTMAMKKAGVTRASVAPYNTQMLVDGAGEPTGVFLDRNYAPIMEYTLFKCVPRITYEDRVAGVRLGCAAYSAVGTTAAYEGHGLTPPLLDAYRQVHAAGDLTVRMQIPLSIPTAAFDNRKIADILHHWAATLRDRGSGDDDAARGGHLCGRRRCGGGRHHRRRLPLRAVGRPLLPVPPARSLRGDRGPRSQARHAAQLPRLLRPGARAARLRGHQRAGGESSTGAG